MSEARGWAKCAVLGVAALIGSSGSVALLAGARLPLDHLIDRIFGTLDLRRRDRARSLCTRVEGALAALSANLPSDTVESAKLTCEMLLDRFGVDDRRLAALELSPQAAATEVLALHAFNSDELVELRPSCERLLVRFYESLTCEPELFAELLPHSMAMALRQLGRLRASQEAIDANVRRVLDIVSAEKSVPLPVLRTILGQMGDGETIQDAGQMEVRLRAKADEYVELKARMNRLSNDDPRVQALRHAAASMIDMGDFVTADAQLAEAEALDLNVVEELEGAARRRRLSAGETRADRGAAARLRLDYRTAAAHFASACAVLPADASRERWGYHLNQADCLYELGRDRADNSALVEAITLLKSILAHLSLTDVPLDWATTQNQLGNALSTLGERENGTARLKEAVAAYSNALRECTRERVPLQWAMTQSNLGTALARLGERESGTERLEGAIAAFRAALLEWRREDAPLDWATAQNNLGNALRTLGERESGTTRLLDAISAHGAALLELTRKRVPMQWARTQNNLGLTLRTLGEREPGTIRLRQAVAAYREALQVCTRERVPLDWALTKNNLGIALTTLGEREVGTARLEQAVAAYREALQECTRERVPLHWAMIKHNLGHVLMIIGERESDTARLQEGVVACCEALLERTRERVPLDWAMTQNSLGNALLKLDERGEASLEEAIAAYRGALLERTRETVPLDWAMTLNNLGIALVKLGKRERSTTPLLEAVAISRAALLERTRERVPLQWVTTKDNLSNALATLGVHLDNADHLHEALECLQMAREALIDNAGQVDRVAGFDRRIAAIEAALLDLSGRS